MTDRPINRRTLASQRSALWLDYYATPEADVAARAAIMAKISELDWQIHSARLGIPPRLLDARLHRDATQATDAVKVVRDYCEGEMARGHCLVLSGPAGVGKSYAAVAALHTAIVRHYRIGFFYFPTLCTALLDSVRRPAALDCAKESAVVTFDDFGAEYTKQGGGFLATLVEEIIWHREGHNLPTLVTTNLTADQLRERCSDRIVDRLRGSWGRVVELPGASLRGTEGDDAHA